MLLCPDCLQKLKELTSVGTFTSTKSIEKIYFFDYYDSPITQLIKSYKYGPHMSLSGFLALFLSEMLKYPDLPVSILPISSHRESVRKRGFSAAEHVIYTCKKYYHPDLKVLNLLKRTGKYVPQASLKGVENRKQNAEKSYRIIKNDIPDEILLFDDIITSGSTLESVARLIKKKNRNCKIQGIVFIKRGA
jgi:predicted amidophosphoribosyltransferase